MGSCKHIVRKIAAEPVRKAVIKIAAEPVPVLAEEDVTVVPEAAPAGAAGARDVPVPVREGAAAVREVVRGVARTAAPENVILPVPQRLRQRLSPIWERTSLSERQFGQAITPASKRQSTWSIPAEEKLRLPPFRSFRSLRGKCY